MIRYRRSLDSKQYHLDVGDIVPSIFSVSTRNQVFRFRGEYGHKAET